VITGWWLARPDANVLLVTGRVFDVLDVPAEAGRVALGTLDQAGVWTGPVAAHSPDRYLFFVASRGAPAQEDEWWTCHLDCVPSDIADTPGIRWHCRDSYVLAPPSRQVSGQQAHWIRPPVAGPCELPDSLRILPALADACEEAAPR
jgi:bifunctional DNA primase/polymerase-like protein